MRESIFLLSDLLDLSLGFSNISSFSQAQALSGLTSPFPH